MPYTYDYARPALTADLVILGRREPTDPLHVLLIQRRKDPFAGCWALPGGFVNELEGTCAAAKRELIEETGLLLDEEVLLVPVGFYDTPGRDPRGWVVSAAYVTYLKPPLPGPLEPGDDAATVGWFPVDSLPDLAFDHYEILQTGLSRSWFLWWDH